MFLFQYHSTHHHNQLILVGTLQKNRADELTQITPKDACSPESWLLFIPVALLLLAHWECCFPLILLNTLYWQLFRRSLLKNISLWGWFLLPKKTAVVEVWYILPDIHKSSSILHNMESICSAKVMPIRSMGVDRIPFASHGWSAGLYKLHI